MSWPLDQGALINYGVLVAAVRFEPTTCRVWTGRSNQLSYAAIKCLLKRQWLRRWDLNLMTSGLWARRATNCSTPRRQNALLFYTIQLFLSTVFKLFLKNIYFLFELSSNSFFSGLIVVSGAIESIRNLPTRAARKHRWKSEEGHRWFLFSSESEITSV